MKMTFNKVEGEKWKNNFNGFIKGKQKQCNVLSYYRDWKVNDVMIQ